MKSRRINSFHYFARLSFLSKSENAKGYNEIEKKFFGYLTLRDVSRNVGFVCFRIFSYMNRIVFAFSRIWNRIVDSTILSIHGKYWCDSVHVRENTGKRKPILGYFTQCESKEFYKRLEGNSKTVCMVVAFNFKNFYNSKTVSIHSCMTKCIFYFFLWKSSFFPYPSPFPHRLTLL